jgi:hypothetical protein
VEGNNYARFDNHTGGNRGELERYQCGIGPVRQLQEMRRTEARLCIGLFRSDMPDRIRTMHEELQAEVIEGEEA